jgi:hypothetical protein
MGSRRHKPEAREDRSNIATTDMPHKGRREVASSGSDSGSDSSYEGETKDRSSSSSDEDEVLVGKTGGKRGRENTNARLVFSGAGVEEGGSSASKRKETRKKGGKEKRRRRPSSKFEDDEDPSPHEQAKRGGSWGAGGSGTTAASRGLQDGSLAKGALHNWTSQDFFRMAMQMQMNEQVQAAGGRAQGQAQDKDRARGKGKRQAESHCDETETPRKKKTAKEKQASREERMYMRYPASSCMHAKFNPLTLACSQHNHEQRVGCWQPRIHEPRRKVHRP